MVQAIILSAGSSSRTYPLTSTKHKSLLKVAGKTILEHLLDQLVKCRVDETILIVNYKKELIIDRFGDEYKGMRLTYFIQSEPKGTWHAVYEARELLQDKFLVLYGDDMVHANDLKRVMLHDYSTLFLKTQNPERFGIGLIEDGKLKSIVEKPKKFIGNLASIGGFWFDRKIFDYTLEMLEGQKEYYLTTLVTRMCKDVEFVPEVIQEYWLPTGYPWDLLTINEYMLSDIEQNIEGFVEQGVTINGKLRLGKGSIVKSGSYIEGNVVIGENCTLGPNCFIRGETSIGDNCRVGCGVELKNSIIMDNCTMKHRAYIGDSILGEGVNVGAGTNIADLRHDGKPIECMVEGKFVSTGRRKLGAVIADGVKLGINTSIYPGRMLWPNVSTMPGEIVIKNRLE